MNFEIPDWVGTFLFVGVALLVIVVPIRVLYDMTRGSRERARRLKELGARLKERFGEVRCERGFPGPDRVRVNYEGRTALLAQPDKDEISIRLVPESPPPLHAVIRTRGRFAFPFTMMWESLRLLPRVRTFEPAIDEAMAIYAMPFFGIYLRTLAELKTPTDGMPTGLEESLVILSRLSGVRAFELRVSPSGGFRVRLRLRSEDLLFRPDDLESALHLYDLLTLDMIK